MARQAPPVPHRVVTEAAARRACSGPVPSSLPRTVPAPRGSPRRGRPKHARPLSSETEQRQARDHVKDDAGEQRVLKQLLVAARQDEQHRPDAEGDDPGRRGLVPRVYSRHPSKRRRVLRHREAEPRCADDRRREAPKDRHQDGCRKPSARAVRACATSPVASRAAACTRNADGIYRKPGR